MNSLSWLLYFAEVSDRANSLFGFLGFMVGMFGIIGIVILWGCYIIEENSRAKKPAIILTFIWATLIIIFTAGGLLLPSSKTIYMIAASEAGEAVVTNPETIEMMGDLKAIIKKRLKEELGTE